MENTRLRSGTPRVVFRQRLMTHLTSSYLSSLNLSFRRLLQALSLGERLRLWIRKSCTYFAIVSTLSSSRMCRTNPSRRSFLVPLHNPVLVCQRLLYLLLFQLIEYFHVTVDAKIGFNGGLTINWSGKSIGSISMPDINITGDVGAQFEVETQFSVSDVGHLADFTRVRVVSSFQRA